MCGEWRTTTLVDVAAKKRWALNGGPFGSKLSRKHYSESGVPVIRGTNLSGSSKFSFDDFVYVSEEKADELRANNAHPGDLIFTQRGTIGQVGLIPFDSPIPRFVISQSQMKLTVDPEQADALFLYYFFSTADTVQQIQNLAFAAGVPHINLDILRKFEISVPPVQVQRRIAGILSAYDELCFITTLAFISTQIKQRSVIAIDEPDTSLHPTWQQSYVRTLLDLFHRYEPRILISTHSPIIISGAEAASGAVFVYEMKDGEAAIFDHAKLSLEEMYDRLFGLITPKNHYLSQRAVTMLNALNSGDRNLNEVLHELDALRTKSYDESQQVVITKFVDMARRLESMKQGRGA